jgi:hypothetical protein
MSADGDQSSFLPFRGQGGAREAGGHQAVEQGIDVAKWFPTYQAHGILLNLKSSMNFRPTNCEPRPPLARSVNIRIQSSVNAIESARVSLGDFP